MLTLKGGSIGRQKHSYYNYCFLTIDITISSAN